jgi:oxaloacetate decarboxylase gamma subunit
MNEGLFSEGIVLMCLGMGFVFIFLVFLVGATTILSNISAKFEKPVFIQPKKTKSKMNNSNDDELVAVMATAIHHHKLK